MTFAGGADPETFEPEPMTVRSHDGLALALDAYGAPDAEAVLLLHGGGQTRHAWGWTAARLAAAGYRALAMDLRGHGESEWSDDGAYELAAFARDIDAVISAVGRPVALVGASLGGLASLISQGEVSPGSATAVVLVDVAPRLEPAGVERILDFMLGRPHGFATLDEAADAIAEYLPHRRRAPSTDGLAKNLRQGDDGRWRWHWDPRFLEGKPASTQEGFEQRLERCVRLVTQPMLLVRGGMSDVVSEQGARELLAMAPDARYVDVEEASHMVAGDRNDVFAEAVIDFLASVRPPS